VSVSPGPEEQILIVDDDRAVRLVLAELLRAAGYSCTTAGGSLEAHRLLDERPFALLLSDVNMPDGSGLELARHVLEAHIGVAAVMVTGVDDPDIATAALELGAYGYLLKPFGSLQVEIQVANALRRRRLELESRRRRQDLERRVDEQTSLLRHSNEETIRRFSFAIEMRNRETGDHVTRVGERCARLAEALGWSRDRCEALRLASLLHDVGKIAIPDRILLKPGPLSLDERHEMQTHTTIGHSILSDSSSPLLALAAEIALHHHERFDGLGYPHGLCGRDIPMDARIVSVVDVFDALTTDRAYRDAYSPEGAAAVMRADRGRQFDAEVLDAFLEILAALPDVRHGAAHSRDAVAPAVGRGTSAHAV
jgi:putative two-component system response regulator